MRFSCGYTAWLHFYQTDLIDVHVQKNIEGFLAEPMDQEVYLKRMNVWWGSHCQQMIMIRSIFLYLDRKFVLQTPTVFSIWDMGLELFRRHISLNPMVQNKIVDGLLLLIGQERQGDAVDRTLLKSLLRMLTDLQLYQDAFEEKLVPILCCQL